MIGEPFRGSGTGWLLVCPGAVNTSVNLNSTNAATWQISVTGLSGFASTLAW
jgi:hypothetical protein